jgi:hypothetical protein
MTRLVGLSVVFAFLAGPAFAATAYYKCDRTDTPETLYLKLDDGAKGALIGDTVDSIKSGMVVVADDFTPVSVSFKQFVKYAFDRIGLVLTRKTIGVSDTFKCTVLNS